MLSTVLLKRLNIVEMTKGKPDFFIRLWQNVKSKRIHYWNLGCSWGTANQYVNERVKKTLQYSPNTKTCPYFFMSFSVCLSACLCVCLSCLYICVTTYLSSSFFMCAFSLYVFLPYYPFICLSVVLSTILLYLYISFSWTLPK